MLLKHIKHKTVNKSDSWEMKNKWLSPFIVSAWHHESASGPWPGRRILVDRRLDKTEMGVQGRQPEFAGQTSKEKRGDTCRYLLRVPLEYSTQYWFKHVYMETKVRQIILSLCCRITGDNPELRGVPVSTTQGGKLLSHGQRVKYSREFLPQ